MQEILILKLKKFPFIHPSGRFLQYITLVTDENLYLNLNSHLLGRKKGCETTVLIYFLNNPVHS